MIYIFVVWLDIAMLYLSMVLFSCCTLLRCRLFCCTLVFYVHWCTFLFYLMVYGCWFCFTLSDLVVDLAYYVGPYYNLFFQTASDCRSCYLFQFVPCYIYSYLYLDMTLLYLAMKKIYYIHNIYNIYNILMHCQILWLQYIVFGRKKLTLYALCFILFLIPYYDLIVPC